mmetsp:Transcript_4543/g.6956  ORF Transcript_4543/g.6956 Transcript_4543/m.6956 type:complete len:421 (+) Transcript_4543:126-1388(+)
MSVFQVRWFRQSLFVCFIVVIVLVGVQFWSFLSKDELKPVSETCNWREGDPQLFFLKTISGVNYDGGHWFHVAENFMVQHSILRAVKGEAVSPEVYLVPDRAAFNDEMNGMTRFMLALGLTSGAPSYLHIGPISVDINSVKAGSAVLLKKSDFLFPPAVYSMAEEIPERFVVSRRVYNSHEERSVCMKYMGTVGGEWPTPQRGHWFPNKDDVQSFRSKIASLCAMKFPSKAYIKNKPYKMVIYQRDLSRVIVDIDRVIATIREKMPSSEDWEISVLIHDNNRSPCSLAAELNNADVLVTAHGFQSMLLLFLPRPSLLFEVYPYRYYKPAYGPLSSEYGVHHGSVMSTPQSMWNRLVLAGITTETCMTTKICREFARSDNVALTERGIQELIGSIETLLQSFKASRSQADTIYPLLDAVKS